MDIYAIFFDVGDTLLGKPGLHRTMQETLEKFGFLVSLSVIQKHHKILFEAISFPTSTNQDFYNYFNAELLYSLGVIPNQDLLDELYYRCRNLRWEKFPDCGILDSIAMPMGIISNWDRTLPEKVGLHFGQRFQTIICSEQIGFQKPAPQIFLAGLNELGFQPSEVVYIGDSLKLDIMGATQVGMKTVLLDRLSLYRSYCGEKILSLEYLPALLENISR